MKTGFCVGASQRPRFRMASHRVSSCAGIWNAATLLQKRPHGNREQVWKRFKIKVAEKPDLIRVLLRLIPNGLSRLVLLSPGCASFFQRPVTSLVPRVHTHILHICAAHVSSLKASEGQGTAVEHVRCVCLCTRRGHHRQRQREPGGWIPPQGDGSADPGLWQHRQVQRCSHRFCCFPNILARK